MKPAFIVRSMRWLLLMLALPFWVSSAVPKHQFGSLPKTWFYPTINSRQSLWQGRWNGVQVHITREDIRLSWLNPNDVKRMHNAGPIAMREKNFKGSALFIRFPESFQLFPEPAGKPGFAVNFYTERGTENATTTDAWITRNLWPGVDFRLEAKGETLKSSFFLNAGITPDRVKWRYEGAKSVSIVEEKVVILTEDGILEEQSPVAYQVINGKRKEIPAAFTLNQGTIGFKLLQAFDPTEPLVLDPSLVFSSYSGSLSDNWGFTATPGPDGRLFSGGVSFGPGFPVTPGAFQSNFQGIPSGASNYDVAILAFNPQGDSLLWATYLGGTNIEAPHSMIAREMDTSLYIMGTTYSANFPRGKHPWDSTFNGNCDLFIAHFSSTGQLINTTFLGGSANDGLNDSPTLGPNYGDWYRGEIGLDHDGRVFVGSCSKSPDFPTSINAFQSAKNAALDGIVAVFNQELSQLEMATFIGAEGEDAVFSIKPLPAPSTSLVVGMVSTGSLPIVSQSAITQKPGGVDGYVAILTGNGKTLRSSSWFGSSLEDWVFFVETNPEGNVYLNGQTNGNVPRVGNCYHVPNSGQFIACFDSSLAVLKWSGNYGSGRGVVDMVPTAFLVDDCGKVYISGSTGKISIPQIEGPRNLPLTADSLMGSANGYDFYMACWSAGFDSLLFATYYGGPISQEHVDGGTSRFDKKGVIYQSVCAGCGGRSDFPVSSGSVVSPVNRALNCNNAVIKLAFQKSNPIIADFFFQNQAPLCPPFSPVMVNPTISLPGTSWQWTTSDGQQSTDSLPNFLFSQPGNYSIKLRVTNLQNCNRSVEVTRQLKINENPQQFLPFKDTCLCKGEPLMLSVPDRFPFFNWSGTANEQVRQLYVIQGGTFILSVTDSNGCKGSDSLLIQMLPCSGEGYNVFTPNQDGLNDEFHPVPDNKQGTSWEVLNRWGQRVFSSTDTRIFWNGKFDNEGPLLEESVYFYRVSTNLCGKIREWRGRVMLLR